MHINRSELLSNVADPPKSYLQSRHISNSPSVRFLSLSLYSISPCFVCCNIIKPPSDISISAASFFSHNQKRKREKKCSANNRKRVEVAVCAVVVVVVADIADVVFDCLNFSPSLVAACLSLFSVVRVVFTYHAMN